MSEYLRGQIYYIESYASTGSEQRAGRPAVIVSNDKNNEHSATVEVVYLTTQPKHDLPTHVVVKGTGRDSIALCEQIHTVAVERIGSFCGLCSRIELQNIDIALLISLDLTISSPMEKVVEVIKEAPATNPAEWQEMEKKLLATEAKLHIVQTMYNDLLQQAISR